MNGAVGKVIRLTLPLTLLAALCACGGGGAIPSGVQDEQTGGVSSSYTIGGTVTGLTGKGLVLQNNYEILAITASGGFTFPTPVGRGRYYTVSVNTQPTSSPAQLCSVAHSDGVALTNVTTVAVTCGPGYTVGGKVTGLAGSGLVLQIFAKGYGGRPERGSSPLYINANGSFSLDTLFPPNSVFDTVYVAVAQQPNAPTQRCVVSNGTVNITNQNQTDVLVACSEFAYVTDTGDDTLSAYEVNAVSGALTAVGTPVAAGGSPSGIVGTTDRKYVFVGNPGSNNVSAFAVDGASGALTSIPGSPFAAGTSPQALALNHNSFLYVANAGSDNLSAYSVDPTTGALTPLTPATYATGKGPSSIAVDNPVVYGAYSAGGGPSSISINAFLYVANNGGSNDISAFKIDPVTGALTPVAGSPFAAGANPLSLAFGRGGKFLYTANPGGTNSSISGFSVDLVSGTLSPLSGSPFSLPLSNYIATDQSGAYLYVTSGANILGYGIDATSGALTALAGFPVGAGANAFSLTIDPLNQFLYVALDGAASVTGFGLDATTGGLNPISSAPFPAGNTPHFIATL
jgi:6-phosphogluconolactonase